jgi:hypothetical protein
MNPRLFEVALKRERLLERIGAQRERLAANTDGLRRVCVGAEKVAAAGRKIRDNPQWVLLATAALVLLRPRRAWRLARTGFFVWRSWLAVRRRLPGLVGR